MKKLGLFMIPIIAAPLLASCSLDHIHSLTFECNDCYLEKDGEEIGPMVTNAKVLELKLVVDDKSKFELPESVTFTAKNDELYDGGTYDPKTGSITVQMTDDITITATAKPITPSYN